MDLAKFRELQIEELRTLSSLLSCYRVFIATADNEVDKKFYEYASQRVTNRITQMLEGDTKLLTLFKQRIDKQYRKDLESKLGELENKLEEEDDFDE